jgi:hypothetical protein
MVGFLFSLGLVLDLLIQGMVSLSPWLTTHDQGVTVVNCARLHIGMPHQEVGLILGASGKTLWDHRLHQTLPFHDAESKSSLCRWTTNEITVSLWFDKNDRLSDGYWDSAFGSRLIGTHWETRISGIYRWLAAP